MRYKTSGKILSILLAGTFLSTSAIAAVNLEPTMDKLKAEAADLSGSYTLTELSGDLPEGMAEVEIGGVKYYFEPSGANSALLSILAGTSAGKLVVDEDGIFELNGQKYNFDVSSIPNSVFSYVEGTEADYNFTIQEADSEGNLTTKYYKIVLNPAEFSTSSSTTWEPAETAGENTIEVQLPNNQTQYFKYTYTKPDNYTETSERTDDTLASANVTNVVFQGISSSSYGGVIYNTQDNSSVNIKADFVSNYTQNKQDYAYGGAVFNSGILGNISSYFIGNYAEGKRNTLGGAIYNRNVINDIEGDFIVNYAQSISQYAQGGAIYNIIGSINSINSNMIGNYAQSSSLSSYGGAIFNDNKASISILNSHFIGNYAGSTLGSSYGGAISNFDSGSYIGNIQGNFIGNYAVGKVEAKGGAIINSGSSIKSIIGDFIENYTQSVDAVSTGGAIYNNGEIGDIIGDFIGNYAHADVNTIYSSGDAHGGAIFNIVGTIGNITGNFEGNYVIAEHGGEGSSYISGGAIVNENDVTIKNINGDFIQNYVYNSQIKGSAYGGAIYNYLDTNSYTHAKIEAITGDFIGNYAQSVDAVSIGGAIYNNGQIGSITGNFLGNYAISDQGDAYGGAVYNDANIKIQAPEFSNNLMYHINLKYGDQEMELYIPQGGTSSENMQIVSGTMTVDNERDFNQYKTYSIYAYLLELSPDNITAEDYIDLMIKAGAINEEDRQEYLSQFYQQSEADQEKALTNIRNNVVATQEMINNATYITEITPTIETQGQLNFYNSSFRNNYVQAANGDALGGAFYGSGIKITADNYTSIIDGNTANGEHNAFYVLNKTGMASFEDDIFPGFSGKNVDWDVTINTSGSGDANDLVLTTSNNGIILVNDGIDGESGYSLGIYGDKDIDDETLKTPQYVKLNNSIANAGSIYVSSNTLVLGTGPYGKGEIISTSEPVTKMTLTNAAFDLYNDYKDEVRLAGWKSDNGYLHIDVDVENLTADVLNVNGNVEGQTNLLVYANSEKDIRGESILFAQSTNDTTGNSDSFKVWRVYKSPYLFDVSYSADETNKEWSLVMNDMVNPDSDSEPEVPDEPVIPDDPEIPDVPSTNVAPEVIAFGALPIAGIEQTRNMVDNVGNQIKNNRYYTRSCSFVDSHWNGESYENVWINPTYYKSSSDSYFDVDTDIWGVEAGGDLQYDVNNRLGLFVSYRNGEYDMSGAGKHYRSDIGSEIGIDSYVAGLYYRYDKNNWYGFATVYGGMQEADLKTKDGVKSDTDGIEFGGSAEVGYDYALQGDLYITPSLGIYYVQINYDDAKDNVGKKAEYDNIRQIEIEAGIKLTKGFWYDNGYANVYIKPSVVQTITDGGEVSISGLGKVESLDDETLGRVEIGGRYGISSVLSAYGWANYTFGSDYDATTFGVGLNYAF